MSIRSVGAVEECVDEEALEVESSAAAEAGVRRVRWVRASVRIWSIEREAGGGL